MVDDSNFQHLPKSHIYSYVPVHLSRSHHIWIPLSKLNITGLVGCGIKMIWQRKERKKVRYARCFSHSYLRTKNKQTLLIDSRCNFSSNWSNWLNLRTKKSGTMPEVRGVRFQPVNDPKNDMMESSKLCRNTSDLFVSKAPKKRVGRPISTNMQRGGTSTCQ